MEKAASSSALIVMAAERSERNSTKPLIWRHTDLFERSKDRPVVIGCGNWNRVGTMTYCEGIERLKILTI